MDYINSFIIRAHFHALLQTKSVLELSNTINDTQRLFIVFVPQIELRRCLIRRVAHLHCASCIPSFSSVHLSRILKFFSLLGIGFLLLLLLLGCNYCYWVLAIGFLNFDYCYWLLGIGFRSLLGIVTCLLQRPQKLTPRLSGTNSSETYF